MASSRCERAPWWRHVATGRLVAVMLCTLAGCTLILAPLEPDDGGIVVDPDADGDVDADRGGDSDTDIDGDVDSDTDTDTDSDTDTDGDMDTDADQDEDEDIDPMCVPNTGLLSPCVGVGTPCGDGTTCEGISIPVVGQISICTEECRQRPEDDRVFCERDSSLICARNPINGRDYCAKSCTTSEECPCDMDCPDYINVCLPIP